MESGKKWKSCLPYRNMIIGQYDTTVNEKGRASFPSKFRKEIGKKIVVAKWYEGCLVLVSEDKWIELIEKLIENPKVALDNVRETDRFIIGSAFEMELDSQGRFVVPQILREYAKLEDEIVFLGLLNRVEIWNKGLWKEKEKYLQEHAGEIIKDLVTGSASKMEKADAPQGHFPFQGSPDRSPA